MIVLFILVLVNYATAPLLVAFGWIRWVKRKEARTLSSLLSLVGFVFASASFLLALGTFIAALWHGGFQYYDSTLLRLFSWGMRLSLGGVLFGILGVWRPSALRWHALGLSTGMFLFWAVSLLME
jgi:hypothetical protein